MCLLTMDMKAIRGRELMIGKAKAFILGGEREELVLELLLPGLFTIILLSCLAHLGYCALQSQLEPIARFQYAISAFAL
jgi:hypothetical protein